MSRLGRTLGFFVTILTLPAAAAAQFPPSPPPLARGTAVIVGQVVDAATGKGISSAVVTLAGSRRAMTTSDGRFAFRALPSGSHSLSAAKSGYIGGAYGMRRPDGATLPVVLADGERRGDIVIWMWRQGSISGSIVDEAGEPVVGIQVTALRRTTVGGRRRFAQGSVGTTDDRGVYRISRLAPGDYAVGMIASQVSVPAATVRQFEETAMSGGDLNRNTVFQAMMQVGATPLMSGTESRQVGDQVQTIGRGAPTPPPIDGAKLFAYPSLYYPAASSASSAAVVTVASGQERTGHRPSGPARADGESIGHRRGRHGTGSDASGATHSPGIRRRRTNRRMSAGRSPTPAADSAFSPCRPATTSSRSFRCQDPSCLPPRQRRSPSAQA